MKNGLVVVCALIVSIFSVVGGTRADLIPIGNAIHSSGNNPLLVNHIPLRLVYDDDQQLIWLDFSTYNRHSWFELMYWSAQMNDPNTMHYFLSSDLELSWTGDWRLPDIDEFEHLYTDELGNTSGLANTGPLWWLREDIYGSGQEAWGDVSPFAMVFNMTNGVAQPNDKFTRNFGIGMFVRSGYIGEPVPEPTTLLLFGTGLAGLAGISRRKKK